MSTVQEQETSVVKEQADRFNAGKPELHRISPAIWENEAAVQRNIGDFTAAHAYTAMYYLSIVHHNCALNEAHIMCNAISNELRAVLISARPERVNMSTLLYAELAAALAYGATKYAENNWTKGLPVSQIVSSGLRHLLKITDSEWMDEESGVSHVGCVMFAVHMLLHQEGDDAYRHFWDGMSHTVGNPVEDTDNAW